MTATPNRTLMLVDDEPNVLAALKRLMRRDGYNIVAHVDPLQALAALDDHPVDVILSDQRMPGMSGAEFLRLARERCPDTVRIVLSGYTDLQVVTDAINEGAVYKFLTKPWDDDTLRSQIREAFHTKVIADENRRLNQALRRANAELQAQVVQMERQAGELETLLETLQEIVQLVPWPILGVDEDGLIALANAAAEDLVRGDGPPLLGRAPDGTLDAALAGNGGAAHVVNLAGRRFHVLRRPMGRRSLSRGWLLALLPYDDPS